MIPTSLTEIPQQRRHYFKIIAADLLCHLSPYSPSRSPCCRVQVSKLVFLKLRSDPVPALMKLLEEPSIKLDKPMELSSVCLSSFSSNSDPTPGASQPFGSSQVLLLKLTTLFFSKHTFLLCLGHSSSFLSSPFYLAVLLMHHFSVCCYH